MQNYKVFFLFLFVLFSNSEISSAVEIEEEIEAYNNALSSNEMREKRRKLHQITLDAAHPERLSAATKILEHAGSTMRQIFCYVEPDPCEEEYINDACKALQEIAKNPQNPLNQCLASRQLYREAKRHKRSSYEAYVSKTMDPNEEFLHQIVMNGGHPEQCRAAIALLDENTIGKSNYGSRVEIPLALMILTTITQTPGHKDCFEAGLALKNAWAVSYWAVEEGEIFYYEEEAKVSFTHSFSPVCVDVLTNLNDQNLFAASSILLHLYETGFNTNEEHKSLALNGLRHVIGNPNDTNQDNAAMLLGNTVILPTYKRGAENELDLRVDTELVNSVLFKSAEDEGNPNQLYVLRWLIERGPKEHAEKFYGILKRISRKGTTKGIEARNLLDEINRKAERITADFHKAVHLAATH